MNSQAGTWKVAANAPSLADLNMAEALKRHHAGQLDAAEALYRAVIALNPNHAEAHYHLGVLYHSQNKLQEAMVSFREAVYVKADFAEAYASLGTVLKAQGLRDNALIFYRQSLMLAPLAAQTHSNMGVLLNDLGRPQEAEEAFRKAMSCGPDQEGGYLNYVPDQTDEAAHERGLAACRRGVRLNPNSHVARYNLGASFKSLCRIDESVTAFRQAIELKPDFAEAHFALGQMLLTRGDFAEGWQEYDWRWKLAEYGWMENIHGKFVQPRWAGEDIRDKTILIFAEQGLGDSIQYARYVREVMARAGKVVLAVHPPLIPLFSQFEAADVVALDQVPLPSFDVQCPLLTLPLLFGTDAGSIPCAVPYLKADAVKVKRWGERIKGDGIRVGVVWAGNPTQKGDRIRSPGLKSVMPVFSVSGVTFVALQMGPGRQDLIDNPLPANVLDLGTEIKDFADTAAIMEGLDLVISSCTAPLHLAGALGTKTWAMIPFSPHLLWQLKRTDSPWYPSVTLYRQDKPGIDWSGVADRIKSDLVALTKR